MQKTWFLDLPISPSVYCPESESVVLVHSETYFQVPRDGLYDVRLMVNASHTPKLDLKIIGELHSEDHGRCPMKLQARRWTLDLREGDKLQFLVLNEESVPLSLREGRISIFRVPDLKL